jgi:LytS/YehU family sensor histidine kinase
MQLLKLYLDIQQTRFKDRLQVSVNVDPAAQQTLIPSLLLQPIVENAVKYGVEPYSDKGLVQIDIHAVNGTLNILVKDNGRKSFEEIDFHSGIGLDNTQERLKQLYGGEHKFSIAPNSSGQGVMVNIEIPNKSAQHAVSEDTVS